MESDIVLIRRSLIELITELCLPPALGMTPEHQIFEAVYAEIKQLKQERHRYVLLTQEMETKNVELERKYQNQNFVIGDQSEALSNLRIDRARLTRELEESRRLNLDLGGRLRLAEDRLKHAALNKLDRFGK